MSGASSISPRSARRAEGPTAFARTKAQADAHLASLDLDWVILRPSLVLAPAAYGGSAMLRGLAGLPWVTPSVASQVQVVSSDDIADTVALCLRADAPAKATWAKATWELTHPQVHDLGDVVAALRAWHGFPPRPRLRVPAVAVGVIAMFAEFAGLLGWRSPARATAMAQLSAGVVGDPSSWIARDRHQAEEPRRHPRGTSGERAGPLVRAALLAQAGRDRRARRVLDRNRRDRARSRPRGGG